MSTCSSWPPVGLCCGFGDDIQVLKVVDPAPVRDPASIQAALCEEALPAQP
jgi:hypothetical protein